MNKIIVICRLPTKVETSFASRNKSILSEIPINILFLSWLIKKELKALLGSMF